MGPTIGIGEEAVITVDANNAGPGKATCLITTPDGDLLDADVVENLDGTFDIFYTAPESGPYKVNIYFGGEPVPHSPYRVTVSDFVNLGKVGSVCMIYVNCIESQRISTFE